MTKESLSALFAELNPETQLELYKIWQDNQDAAVSRLLAVAKKKGQEGYDFETVKRLIEEFITEVEKNDDDNDIELTETMLSAVAGGGNSKQCDAAIRRTVLAAQYIAYKTKRETSPGRLGLNPKYRDPSWDKPYNF